MHAPLLESLIWRGHKIKYAGKPPKEHKVVFDGTSKCG